MMKFLLIILILSGIKIQENYAVLVCSIDFEGQNCVIDGDCGLHGKCVANELGIRSCECIEICSYGNKCVSDDECGEKGKCTWVHPQGRPWESVKRCKCKEECIEGTKCMFNEQCGENGICDRKYSFIYSKVGYCTCKTVKPPKVCFDHKMCMKDEDCGKYGKCKSKPDTSNSYCDCQNGVPWGKDCQTHFDCWSSPMVGMNSNYRCIEGKCVGLSHQCWTYEDCATGAGYFCDFELGFCLLDPNEGRL